jgi:hypothetical protein
MSGSWVFVSNLLSSFEEKETAKSNHCLKEKRKKNMGIRWSSLLKKSWHKEPWLEKFEQKQKIN